MDDTNQPNQPAQSIQPPQVEQPPVMPTPNIPPQQPTLAPMPPTTNGQETSPIAWIGLGLVVVAMIMYIVMQFTKFSTPLNIIIFSCSLLGVIMAIIPAAMKKVKWLDWRVMSAILLGAFIALITGISQIQYWNLESKLKNAGLGESSQQTSSDSTNNGSSKSNNPSTEDILNQYAEVTIGQFTATTDSYGYTEQELPVTIKNKSNETQTFMFEIEAVSSDGTRIATAYATAEKLAPGQSFTYKAFRTDRNNVEQLKTATFKVFNARLIKDR